MRKRFFTGLLALLLVSIAFGQYVAPNEDTVVIVGGLGTQANKAELNGGGATKVVWDAGSPSDFINTNGGPKRTASCAFTTATKNLNGTDIGNGITAGTLCYVSTGDGSHITAGVYEITTVTDNDNIICLQMDDDGSNDTGVTVNVGGALDDLQNALDNPLNDASSYNRYIYDNLAESISTQIDHDTNSGSVATRLFVTGYNSALDAEAEITLTATADIVALIRFDADVAYSEWKLIDFYAGGKDASKAEYALNNNENASNYHNFIKCKFRGAEKEGLHIAISQRWSLFDCEMSLNGTYGIGSLSAYLKVIACSIHDNDTHGVAIQNTHNLLYSCLFYDNGKDGATGDGLNVGTTADEYILIGCTSHGNYNDGFHIDDLANYGVSINNTAVKNGDYGFDLQGKSIQPASFFGYNHAYDNDQNAGIAAGGDYCSECATEAAFQTFRNGNNQTGDPKFTNTGDGTEDFTPASGSDLIDNALDAGVN